MTAHGRRFSAWRTRRTTPLAGAGSAHGVWDARPVARIQCCDVQITRNRNKLRGRRASPTITAIPTMYNTRGNDHRGARNSANSMAAVAISSASIPPLRIPSCADTIHAANDQRSIH